MSEADDVAAANQIKLAKMRRDRDKVLHLYGVEQELVRVVAVLSELVSATRAANEPLRDIANRAALVVRQATQLLEEGKQ